MSLRPTTGEVLDSVLWALEHQLAPELDDEHLISSIRTIINLVRHVRARVELEPPALVDDNAEIRSLLESARQHGLTDDAPEVSRLLDETLREPPVCPGTWPSPALLTAEADRLRTVLSRLIEHLDEPHGAATTDGSTGADRDPRDDPFGGWRVGLEAYLEAHLGRGATWETDPFQGERR